MTLMASHRVYARPFALANADSRCLWTGLTIASGPRLDIEEPLGRTTWRCRGEHERVRVSNFLDLAARYRIVIRFGILGVLSSFLILAVIVDRGHLAPLQREDLVAYFRGAIALIVLPLGLFGPYARARAPGIVRAPFPVHIQALIGSAAVVWLFRIVGSIWLGLALWHLASRAGAR
ncbi:MAG: hypothetical protein HC882_06210 [Acidobacteria bacterium]|nr:hypothetical protein [Acidobacteriota bacterium]